VKRNRSDWLIHKEVIKGQTFKVNAHARENGGKIGKSLEVNFYVKGARVNGNEKVAVLKNNVSKIFDAL
jgi:hypothetical protein